MEVAPVDWSDRAPGEENSPRPVRFDNRGRLSLDLGELGR